MTSRPVSTVAAVLALLAAGGSTRSVAAAPAYGLPLGAMTSTSVVPEYNAKAGYLLLFCRYVEWPPSAFDAPDAPIVIGVLGENPFGDVLVRTTAGQSHNGRGVVVMVTHSVEQARRCHVVFIPRGSGRQQAAWLEALRESPVLTVVENADALADGAVVAFAMESGSRGTRLKFDASQIAAERAGLRISAPMLSAARRVIRGPLHGGGG